MYVLRPFKILYQYSVFSATRIPYDELLAQILEFKIKKCDTAYNTDLCIFFLSKRTCPCNILHVVVIKVAN